MLLDKDPSMTLAEDADEMEQIFIKGDVAVLIGFEGCLLLINPNINTYHLLIHRSTCSRLQFSCTPFYARPGDTIYIPCWCSVYHTIRKGVLSEGRWNHQRIRSWTRRSHGIRWTSPARDEQDGDACRDLENVRGGNDSNPTSCKGSSPGGPHCSRVTLQCHSRSWSYHKVTLIYTTADNFLSSFIPFQSTNPERRSGHVERGKVWRPNPFR